MKVVCIKPGGWYGSVSGEKFPGPAKGDTVTVVSSYVDPNGLYCYILLEYKPVNDVGRVIGYAAQHFAPISSIEDEAEILEHEHEPLFI